jgi:cytochrome c peroxidase
MNRSVHHLLHALAAALAVGACTDRSEPEPTVLFTAPPAFPAPVYDLSRNPLTPAGVELGRRLFYDPLLSRDGSIACAECHRQDFGFTHHGHDVSHGIDNRMGTRNSQPVQNLAWEPNFFWDGGVHDLDLQPIAPLENPVEMDDKLGTVLQKLRQSPKYPALFKAAYGSPEITTAAFLKALAQFMLTLVSANSRYDRYLRGQEAFTDDEKAGLRLFSEKGCATCHAGTLFTDHSFRNNGIGPGATPDSGRARITENATDLFKFRVPSLRNVEVTKPYMHDGRFYDLETVIDHYRERVKDGPTLDPLLRRNGRLGIAISDPEKRQLVAFLKTLTDHEFLTNPRFAEPSNP